MAGYLIYSEIKIFTSHNSMNSLHVRIKGVFLSIRLNSELSSIFLFMKLWCYSGGQ